MKFDLQAYGGYGQLWLAVLLRAVEDASAPLSPLQDNQGEYFYQRRARLWMVTNRKSPGSLHWICDTLGIDPENIRAEMRRRWGTDSGVYRTGSSARIVIGKDRIDRYAK